MLLGMTLQILNAHRRHTKVDWGEAVFGVFYYLCVLVSLILAEQDGLGDIAGEAPNGKLDRMGELPHSGEVIQQDNTSTAKSELQTLDELRLHSISGERLPVEISSSTKSSETSGVSEWDEYEMDEESVYIGPEVLVDMEPEEMVLSGSQPSGRRKPVKDGFSYDQKMELLRLHNLYRSNTTPSAANMNFMEWDEDLAVVAQQWANGCIFEHGFPATHSYQKSMGQNLYMGWDPEGGRALLLWYEEYKDYDLKENFCPDDKKCGHYTQMAWGESRLLGCGMKRCGNRRFYIVCHYHPAGNIAGMPPFIVGKPCSQCSTVDGGLCTDNLCVTKEQCERNTNNCHAVCSLECQNCGVLNRESCRCDCADGWDSLDCSRQCADGHDRCGKSPGWPTKSTCALNHHDVGNIYCRKMCGKCRGLQDLNDVRKICCRGVLCGEGQVLDLELNLCQCRNLCPGPMCHYPSDYEGGSSVLAGSTAMVAVIVIIHLTHL